jgi:hypothetical protein
MARDPSREPTDEQRREAYAAVRSVVGRGSAFPPGAVETAQFLLDEAKEAYSRTSARVDSMESKATTLLGIVAGGSGALGAFAISHDVRAMIATPLLIGALCSVTFALSCALFMLRPRTIEEADDRAYVSAEVVAEDQRIPLALLFANAYGEMNDQLQGSAQQQYRALLLAYAATALAALLVVSNAALAGRSSLAPAAAAPSGQQTTRSVP